MPVTGALAVGAGVLVLLLFARLLRGAAGETDPTMVWEARVAMGFTALVVGGPVWLVQLVLTLVATLYADATAWLWLWWVAAPVVGAALGSRGTPTH